jgi:hypothetical protein
MRKRKGPRGLQIPNKKEEFLLKDRSGDQRGGGVNGSQSKFLTEFGLYPKLNPNPLNKTKQRNRTGEKESKP